MDFTDADCYEITLQTHDDEALWMYLDAETILLVGMRYAHPSVGELTVILGEFIVRRGRCSSGAR